MSVSVGVTIRPLARGYTREPSVEAEITALSGMDLRERLRRLEHLDDALLSPESLVYWARQLRAAGDDDGSWRVLSALTQRSSRTVASWVSRIYGLSRDEREELIDSLVSALYEEWMSSEDGCAFWEVHFSLCLKRKLIDAVKRHRRLRQVEVHLPDTDRDVADAEDPLERVPDFQALDPAQAAELACALDSLPSPLREAVYLYFHEGWTEDRIGRHLGCTGRTVRNYLRRAKELLAPWRDSEHA